MKPYRNKQYTDSARDQRCVNCGYADGTVTACHLSIPGFSGQGTKCHDFMVAECCSKCHDLIDGRVQPSLQNDYEHRMRLMCWTLERKLCDGEFDESEWVLVKRSE